MGKVIYLISFLRSLKIFMFLGSIILLVLGGVLVFIIEDSKLDLDFYLKRNGLVGGSYDEEIKSKDEEIKENYKKFKIVLVLLLLCTLGTILIPEKEEMYAIALTQNYKVEDVYKMTKGEIRDNIDYLFKKIEELKK